MTRCNIQQYLLMLPHISSHRVWWNWRKTYVITSSREVLFLPVSVCLLFACKVFKQFAWNLVRLWLWISLIDIEMILVKIAEWQSTCASATVKQWYQKHSVFGSVCLWVSLCVPKTANTICIQVAQLWQTDRATVVCCAYAWKVHCVVVGSCYTSGRPCTEHVCLCHMVSVFWRGQITFGEYLTGKGRRPPTTVGVRNLESLPFQVVLKYLQCII